MGEPFVLVLRANLNLKTVKVAGPDDRDLKNEDMHRQYRNKKNQKIYTVLDLDLINCTNAVDGQRMVLYTIDGKQFAREYKEFMLKFEEVNHNNSL